MLSISADLLAAVESGAVRKRELVKITLPSGATGLWNGEYDVSYDSVTYGGVDGNLIVNDIVSTAGLNVEGVEVIISGLLPVAINIIRTQAWHQAPVSCYRAFLNATGGFISVDRFFVGFLDNAPISDSDGDVFAIQAKLETYNRELDRAMGRVSSDSDQRNVGGATDGFNKWAAATTTKNNIYWGRAGPRSPVNTQAPRSSLE